MKKAKMRASFLLRYRSENITWGARKVFSGLPEAQREEKKKPLQSRVRLRLERDRGKHFSQINLW